MHKLANHYFFVINWGVLEECFFFKIVLNSQTENADANYEHANI